MRTLHLAEETRLHPGFDEDISASTNPPYEDEAAWGSDPMDILMAKQERERDELMAYMCDCLH